MSARKILLKIHLFLGAAAAVFLIILGLTGSVIAFENDIDHWLNPGFYYVDVREQSLPESGLIRAVEQTFAPARVASVHIFRQPSLAHIMQLTDRSTVTVSPYDGHILGRRTAASAAQKYVGYLHQLHTHLVPDPRSARTAATIGGDIVQVAGAILCLLVPTGFLLWWRDKRARVKWRAPWYRVSFDLHQTTGIYAALALMILALTGVLIGQEEVLYSITHSPALTRFPALQSTSSASAPITTDRAEEIARAALPNTTVTDVMLPENPRGVFAVILRTPEETSEAAHSYVFVDQYTGKVLHVRNFLTNSPGYRAVRFNRSIHTGDVWGAAGHAIAAVSSLLLVVMASTGLVIWLNKLAT